MPRFSMTAQPSRMLLSLLTSTGQVRRSQRVSGSYWLMNVTAPSLSGGSRTLRVYAAYGDWQINSTVPVSYYTAPAPPEGGGSSDTGGSSSIAPPAAVKTAKITDYPSSISLAPGESFGRDITVNNTGNAKLNVTISTTLAWATAGPAKEILAGSPQNSPCPFPSQGCCRRLI